MKEEFEIILDKKIGRHEFLENFLIECVGLAGDLDDKDPFDAGTDGLRVYALIEMVRKAVENV